MFVDACPTMTHCLTTILIEIRTFLVLFWYIFIYCRREHRLTDAIVPKKRYSMTTKIPYQIIYIRDIVGVSDDICKNNLRMPINTFQRLCFLLENVGGLGLNKHVSVEEQVAIFLSILSHHKKNVNLQTDFKQSATPLAYISIVCWPRSLNCTPYL